MTEFAIEIDKLTKIYKKSQKSGEKIALNSIDLKIKKGSFFGLLGPNGAGKSTLINIIGGLVNKTTGIVKIADKNIDFDNSYKFHLGIVPQEVVIDPFFTVYETLEIYAGYFGVRKEDRKTDEIIEALGLKDKAKVRPRSLSGGMKRRLLVAKSLVHNPEIIILDEPTAGVDVELRLQLWNYVKKLNLEGKTIVLTTHYLQEAQELCDEIAVIDNGKVIACDKKQNLMNLLAEKEVIINFAADIDVKNIDFGENVFCNQIKNDVISFNYDPNKIKIAEILTKIMQNGLEIKDISTKEPDLEKVFRHIIKKN